MKSLDEIMSQIDLGHLKEITTSETLLADSWPQDRLNKAKAAVGVIFNKLSIAMPARFSAMYPTAALIDSASELWAEVLITEKITPRMVDRAIIKAIKSDRCPDLASFIKLCQPDPEDYGLPDLEKSFRFARGAYHNCNEDNFSCNPVVWTAMGLCSMTSILAMPEDKAMAEWKKAYEKAIKMYVNGEPMRLLPKDYLIYKPREKHIEPEIEECPIKAKEGNEHLAKLKKYIEEMSSSSKLALSDKYNANE